MFVVTARRTSNAKEGDADLRGFIDKQIEIAKAPAKTHALVRSGASVGPARDPVSMLEPMNGAMEIVHQEANPLAIAVKERSHAYLSASYLAPNSTPSGVAEPGIKQSRPDLGTSAYSHSGVPTHAPDYSAGRLPSASEVPDKQQQQQILLPRSAKRWNVQRNPSVQRAAVSTWVGLGAPVDLPNFELKTKEGLASHLDNVEQWLKPFLDCSVATLAPLNSNKLASKWISK